MIANNKPDNPFQEMKYKTAHDKLGCNTKAEKYYLLR